MQEPFLTWWHLNNFNHRIRKEMEIKEESFSERMLRRDIENELIMHVLMISIVFRISA